MRGIKLIIFIIFLSIILKKGVSQNQVPNGDFETYISCPSNFGQINYCLFWTNPSTYLYGADYYNRCSPPSTVGVPLNNYGFKYAHSGNAYCGLGIYNHDLSNYREYIEVRLKAVLLANVCYHFSMYVNLAKCSQLSSNNISIYLSDTIIVGINNYLPLPYSPQIDDSNSNIPDTSNWSLIEGNYTASGGEQYLLIGNFKNDLFTNITIVNSIAYLDAAYIYIDDVSLYPCDAQVHTAKDATNKTICKGENVELGIPYYEDYKYKWFAMDGTFIDSTNYINVSPDTTTSYILRLEDFKYDFTTDTVTVTVDENCTKPLLYIPNIFSPNGDGHNDVFRVRGEQIESLHLQVYNRWGNMVFESRDVGYGWDGTYKGKECEVGVYYWLAEIVFKNGEQVFKKGSVSLVR